MGSDELMKECELHCATRLREHGNGLQWSVRDFRRRGSLRMQTVTSVLQESSSSSQREKKRHRMGTEREGSFSSADSQELLCLGRWRERVLLRHWEKGLRMWVEGESSSTSSR